MSLIMNIIRLNNRNSISSFISFKRILCPELQTLKSLSQIKWTDKKQLSSSTGSKNFMDSKKFKAFKAKQAKMQCDDGYPVHLKGGLFDKILYHITVGACVIGLIQSFWLLYVLAKT